MHTAPLACCCFFRFALRKRVKKKQRCTPRRLLIRRRRRPLLWPFAPFFPQQKQHRCVWHAAGALLLPRSSSDPRIGLLLRTDGPRPPPPPLSLTAPPMPRANLLRSWWWSSGRPRAATERRPPPQALGFITRRRSHILCSESQADIPKDQKPCVCVWLGCWRRVQYGAGAP
jgi:hypothetical protein